MTQLDELRKTYAEGRLCIFVGAGVSRSCGLPDWRSLARDVTKSMWSHENGDLTVDHLARLLREKALEGLEPLESMRYVRRVLKSKFKAEVRRSLYSQGVQVSETVQEIVLMQRVSRICCFNYDDILETALKKAGRKFECIVEGDKIKFLSELTLIFHPHGYLPRRRKSSHPASPDVVLSEDDYHRLYSSPYSWPNVVQLTLLLNYSALFIGCSLLDPNLRRIVDIVGNMQPAHKHYAFLPDPVPARPPESDVAGRRNWLWTARFKEAAKKLRERDLEDRGVLPIWWKEDSEIAERLREITSDTA